MIIVLSLLIAVSLVGCGLQSAPGQSTTGDDQVPPGQVKKTELEGESGTSQETAIVLSEESSPTPTEEPTSTCTMQPQQVYPVESATEMVTGGEKEQMIAKVKADLASRLGISQEVITVVSAEAVTWNDSSLGCPIEGMMYTQVLTPGYQIILMAKGVEYDYRTDQANFKLCQQ